MKPEEFKKMTWGDYMRISIGHKYKEIENTYRYRNILAAELKVKPFKVFEMPGDFDHIPRQLSMDEKMKFLKKRGLDVVLGLNKMGEC